MTRTTFPPSERDARMTQKDFVVSADGHLLEPTDLFRTRLPEHLRDRGVWEEDFEIEPLVEGGARIFRQVAHAGVRGLDDLALPPDGRADARRRPRAHPRRHGPRRGRRPGDAPEPVAVRALLRRPRAVDGARPRVQRLRHRAVHAVLLASRPPRPSRSPTSTTPSPRSSASPPAGFRAILLPATPPKPYYSRDFDPVWAAAQANGVHVFIHTQTGGVKVDDPPSTTLKVVMESAAQVNQPMTEKSAVEADDHAVRLRPDGPAAGHVRADRRRRPRALPRPALRADRVQRALARVAGGRDGQVLGHRDRPGRRLVARALGRQPRRQRPAQHGAAVPAEREVAVPADAERVRAAPVPRLVPGRPRGRRMPARHRAVDDRVGQRLPARGRNVPREPAS